MATSRFDVSDAVQDCFLRYFEMRRGGSRVEQPKAWLVRVLINVCRDGWRKRAVRTRLDPQLDTNVMSRATQEDALIARSDVWRALGTLTPHRRAIIVLYELEGATIASIAQTLGVAPVTVRWHLSRGRKQLAVAIRSANEPTGEQS